MVFTTQGSEITLLDMYLEDALAGEQRQICTKIYIAMGVFFFLMAIN